jgi:predicted membrane-bound spermidine synthase
VTFLLGLALGSLLFALLRNKVSAFLFAMIQAGIGLSSLRLIPFFSWLPDLFLKLFTGPNVSYGHIQFIQFLIVALVVLLPTTLMGMSVPCLMGILVSDMDHVGGKLGLYYAINTVGAVTGALLSGFFLLPALGTQNTLALGVFLNLSVALGVLFITHPNRRVFLIPPFLLIMVILFLFPEWNRNTMIAGVSIYPEQYREIGLDTVSGEREILYFKEGISTTIAVVQNEDGGKVFRVNGKADAGTDPDDMETAERLALVPMALHPDPRQVAIIGLGSGVSAGVATLYETVEQIDIVEIEPAVVDAARYFKEENLDVLADGRVNVHIDDALAFLKGAPDKYDTWNLSRRPVTAFKTMGS